MISKALPKRSPFTGMLPCCIAALPWIRRSIAPAINIWTILCGEAALSWLSTDTFLYACKEPRIVFLL
ncbi:Uncharacterised protein [Vibrio cholerae]|nr:Uncharacterised protein [Vibrio cholerae]